MTIHPAVKWIGGAFLAGVVVGALVLGAFGRHQYASLRAFADSSRTASATETAALLRHSDSLEAVVAQLAARRTVIVTQVVTDTTRVDSALALAKTASDSAAQVPALRTANRNLFQAVAISDSMVRVEKAGHDSALVVVETLNRTIANMAGRIDHLQGLPKWAKVGLGTVALVGAAYGGYRLGQGH